MQSVHRGHGQGEYVVQPLLGGSGRQHPIHGTDQFPVATMMTDEEIVGGMFGVESLAVQHREQLDHRRALQVEHHDIQAISGVEAYTVPVAVGDGGAARVVCIGVRGIIRLVEHHGEQFVLG